jgi:hypothetical protein
MNTNIFKKLFAGEQVTSVGVNHTIDTKSIVLLCAGLFVAAAALVVIIKTIK